MQTLPALGGPGLSGLGVTGQASSAPRCHFLEHRFLPRGGHLLLPLLPLPRLSFPLLDAEAWGQ